MKKILLIFLLIHVGRIFGEHGGVPELSLKILSREAHVDTINERFFIHFKIYFNDTFQTDSLKLKMKMPRYSDESPESPYFVTSTYYLPNNVYYPQDSICDSIEIDFSKENIPFYFQTLRLCITDFSDSSIFFSEFLKVYFTPYRTIELWNENDFDGLKRVWDTPREGDNDLWTYFAKDSLPISNIPDSIFFNDSIPISYISHPALPYLVPVSWIDDIYDSPSSNNGIKRSDGCGTNKQRWKGTITGNITTLVDNDLVNQGTVTIPISGIKVQIMERDGGLNPDDILGETYTDINGNFSVLIDECQRFTGSTGSWNEGNDLEIYLKIVSTNESESIKVRHRIGGAKSVTINRSNVWYWNYNNGNTNNLSLGNNIRPSKEIKPQLLHWGNLCRNFVNGSDGLSALGVSLGSKQRQLDIMIHPLGPKQGGVFIPHGAKAELVLTLLYPGLSNDDCVYIGREDENDEDVFFHEFGHYVMWELQGRSWQNPIDASFANHGDEYNAKNPMLAWNEGWATGFGSIVDLYYKEIDNEAGSYSFGLNIERRTIAQNLIDEDFNTVDRGSGSRALENTVTLGFVSEASIAALIYDLFDSEINFGRNFNLNSFLIDETFNDGGNDVVGLSFAQIAQPFLNNQGTGFNSELVIKDITVYAKELAEILPCEQRRFLQPLFIFNRIRSLDDPITALPSTDRLAFNLAIDHPTFKFILKRREFMYMKDVTFGYQVDLAIIDETRENFNLSYVNDDETIAHLSDPLTVTNNCRLYFNGNVSENWVEQSGPNPQENSRLGAFISNDLEINNGAIMEIGSYDEKTFSDVHVCKGSTLILRRVSGTVNPVIIVNNNSSLIIEEGAVFQYYPNTTIILNGPNAVLEIKGELQVMNGATFTVTGGAEGLGYVRFFKNENLASPRLINSPTNDGNVYFLGTSRTAKLVEIDGSEGLIVGSDIVDFRIASAQVKMGEKSMLKLEISGLATTLLVNVNQLYTGLKHRGIYVGGIKNEFISLAVYGGERGFTNYFSTSHNANLTLRNVIIEDCDYGIYSYEGGINYYGGHIYGYTYSAWKALGLSKPSILSNLTVENTNRTSNTIGIDIEGNGSFAQTSMFQSSVGYNEIGALVYYSDLVLNSCNTFVKNNIGVDMESWTKLYMRNSSFTKFDENSGTQLVTRYHGSLFLNNGHNGFINQSTPSHLFACLEPTAMTSQILGTTYLANDNYFEGTLKEAPLSGSTYFINPRGTIKYYTLGGVNLTYSTKSNWTTAYSGNCVGPDDNNTTGTGLGELVVPSRYTSINTVNVNCSPYSSTSIINACSPLLDSLNTSLTPDLNYIISNLSPIVNCSFSNHTPLMHELQRELLSQLQVAYSLGISKGQIYVSPDSISAATSQLIDVLDGLLTKAYDTIRPWDSLKFELTTAKAEIHRLAEHRDDAIDILTDALTEFTDSMEQIILYRNICVNEAEKAYLNHEVSLDSMYIVYSCFTGDTSGGSSLIRPSTSKLNTTKSVNSLKIYPNPSSLKVMLTVGENEAIKEVSIFDGRGMIVKKINFDISSYSHELVIDNLNAGTYFIHVVTGSNVYNQLLSVIK